MAPNAGYVLVGYLLTAASLGGYTLWLLSRARAARRRAETIAQRRGER
jgi:hypothetical protein